MEEAIVDSVDENNIVTDVCCVLDLDLYRCSKEDLDFVSPYKLRMRRKDDVHALVRMKCMHRYGLETIS